MPELPAPRDVSSDGEFPRARLTRNEDQNADPIEIVDPNEETDEPTVLAHFNAPAKASVGTNEAAGQFWFRTVPKHGDKRAYDTDRTTASNR